MSAFGGFSSGFGASAASAPFGAASPAAPFGQAATGQGGFGSPAPTFGGASTPAFGSTVAGGFGSGNTTFGAAQPATAFGSGFGASQPATGLFGASTPQVGFGGTSAFGATPAFGAAAAATPAAAPAFGGGSPFGSSGFGASSSPAAFGSTATPAFGTPSAAPAFGSNTASGFGSTGFGTTSGGAFGSSGLSFGGAAAASPGTRQVPYSKTVDHDPASSVTGAGGVKQNVNLNSISAMEHYKNKQPEELRWEDYAAGVKGGTGQQQGAMPFGQTVGGAFAATSSPFGASPAASSPAFGASGFGSTAPAFGASAPAFGSTGFGSPAPAFGTPQPTFGASSASTGLFGAAAPASPFGSTSTATAFGGGSSFGSSAPALAFGSATSTPAFGASSTPAFGANPFGGGTFGASSAPASSSAFGGSFSAFGSAPATSSSLFGSTQPAPAFGSTQPTPFGAPSTPAFSFSSTPAAPFASSSVFGAASTPPQTGGIFGGTTQPKAGGLFAPSSTFGSSAPGAFGAPSNTGFGQTSALAFSSSSLFGGSAPQFLPAPTSAPAPVLLPGVATSPYGTLPAAPQLSSADPPEHKVGLTQRPLGPMMGRNVSRPTSVMTPRSITPRAGVRLRAARPRSASRAPSSGLDSQGDGFTEANGAGLSSDPRHLFVRDPLPSTTGAASTSSAPATGPTQQQEPQQQHQEQRRRGSDEIRPARSASPQTVRPDEVDEDHDGSPSPRYDQRNTDATPEPWSSPSDWTERRGQHSGRRGTDDEVMDLLPRLDPRSDLSLKPSLTQLAAMAASDPSSLASVSNFTISRPGIGSVCWLEEVDVRHAEIEELVRLTKGGVEVYLDDTAKPPVGEGFNRPARITLLNVYKLDSTTRRQTKDPEAIERFTIKLKKVSAQQGARFVSYKPDRGEWQFEVDHFSRYGLLDDSDEEDGPQGGVVNTHTERSRLAQRLTSVAEDGSDETQQDEVVDVELGDGSQISADNHLQPQPGQTVPTSESGRPLPVMLPALLQLAPEKLASMRQSLFDKTERAEVTAAMATQRAAPTAWLPPNKNKCALTPAPQADGALAELQMPRTLTAPQSSCGPALALLAQRDVQSPGASSLIDLGILLGDGRRAGWGPGGCFTQTGISGRTQRSQLRQISTSARLTSQSATIPGTRSRDLLEAALKVHAQYSSAIPGHGPQANATGSDSNGLVQDSHDLPLWSLKCGRQELQQLCLRFTELCTSFINKHDLVAGLERSCLQHEAWTWDLVRVLFETLPSDFADTAQDCAHTAVGTQQCRPLLAALERRAALSHWLQDFARSHVETSLCGGATGCAAVLAALSGHQLPAAAAVAATAGDVRLASIIAQGSNRRATTSEVASQLRVWEDSGLISHMELERLQVYRILGGQLDDVVSTLPGLPWRAALGMHLWYGRGGSSSIQEALDDYENAVAHGAAPPPLPLHAERHPTASQGSLVDVDLQLLRVYAGKQSATSGEDGAAGNGLAHLLAAGGYTREDLDARPAWLLAAVLFAIGVLPEAERKSPQAAELTTSFIGQLEAVGGMEHWTVYAALHLPDNRERKHAVMDLLCRHAPIFSTDGRKRAFLLQRLGISRAAVAYALEQWAASRNMLHEQIGYLAEAGPESLAAARKLAAEEVVPHLLLSNSTQDLEALMAHLRCSPDSSAGPLEVASCYLKLQDASAMDDQGSLHSAAAALVEALQLPTPTSAAAAAAAALVAATLSHHACETVPEACQVAMPRMQQRDVLNDMMLLASSNPIVA